MYLVTGCAGFIGMHLSIELLKKNKKVLGIDNLNSYYDVKLKKKRLSQLKKFKNFKFKKIDIQNLSKLKSFTKTYKIKYIINLAAQAGVRYSVSNPEKYFESNIKGFFNMLEIAKIKKIKHFIYASSSSVYGASQKKKFKEIDNVDQPVSFYASSKRCNELMAHSYSNIYNLPVTGLRYFSVYGPWGRPDMSLFIFTKKILSKKKIDIFNKGKMKRDFTYIDDVVKATYKIIHKVPQIKDGKNICKFKILNIGGGNTIKLSDYVSLIEKNLNIKAKKNLKGMQLGDVKYTLSDKNELKKYIGFYPKTNIEKGIKKFTEWFKNLYLNEKK
jgi:UDP-glucuronate 4-epimerase